MRTGPVRGSAGVWREHGSRLDGRHDTGGGTLGAAGRHDHRPRRLRARPARPLRAARPLPRALHPARRGRRLSRHEVPFTARLEQPTASGTGAGGSIVCSSCAARSGTTTVRVDGRFAARRGLRRLALRGRPHPHVVVFGPRRARVSDPRHPWSQRKRMSLMLSLRCVVRALGLVIALVVSAGRAGRRVRRASGQHRRRARSRAIATGPPSARARGTRARARSRTSRASTAASSAGCRSRSSRRRSARAKAARSSAGPTRRSSISAPTRARTSTTRAPRPAARPTSPHRRRASRPTGTNSGRSRRRWPRRTPTPARPRRTPGA